MKPVVGCRSRYSADFFFYICVFIVVIFKIDDQEWSSGKPRWRETITPDANEERVYDNRTKQIRMVRMTVCCCITREQLFDRCNLPHRTEHKTGWKHHPIVSNASRGKTPVTAD